MVSVVRHLALRASGAYPNDGNVRITDNAVITAVRSSEGAAMRVPAVREKW
jgi:hypothetical protein